jgi:hypothetical protein
MPGAMMDIRQVGRWPDVVSARVDNIGQGWQVSLKE